MWDRVQGEIPWSLYEIDIYSSVGAKMDLRKTRERPQIRVSASLSNRLKRGL